MDRLIELKTFQFHFQSRICIFNLLLHYMIFYTINKKDKTVKFCCYYQYIVFINFSCNNIIVVILILYFYQWLTTGGPRHYCIRSTLNSRTTFFYIYTFYYFKVLDSIFFIINNLRI
jgi:hypothetical protein